MSNDKGHHLILGGARSGKSRYAEQCALASGRKLFYLATATAGDSEMAERIKHHQSRRDDQWILLEETVALFETLRQNDHPQHCILVDCLTLWLSNCLHHECWPEQRDALLTGSGQLQSEIIFVSNEVGSGIVPLGELSRQFVDESGFLHQALAQQCEQVSLVVAGLPLTLKPSSEGRV